MVKPIFSASWYRVAGLKPRLRSQAQIHRHRYRGEICYVLQDISMERFLRFSPAAYSIIGTMDGERTVDEIWQQGCARLGDDAPTQDDMVQLLTQLYRADVLQCDVSPDAAEILERHEEQARRQWRSRVFSLFSWRFPLFDPERFLQKFLPLVRPFFGWPGLILWLSVVAPATLLISAHWADFTMNVLDRLLAPKNLLFLWLLFPLIKAVHEFGHAFAARAYGGEVHDMGVMLLVLTPVPYVDASSASAFRDKWQRVVVGAAGMIVELFIAALAIFIWLNVEPGMVRTLAYNTVLIAGISTLLFNGNPLLRYDGYYILADLIEIPNLRTRANNYLGYIAERFLFGNRDAEAPMASSGERVWFVSYGILSFFYRIFVVVAILFYLAERLFELGALLAAVAAVIWAAVPVIKGLNFLFTSPRLRPVRRRALAVTAAFVLLLSAILLALPAPYRTKSEGVVWIPEEAFVRAAAEGFIERIVAPPGSRVRKGDILLLLNDPVLLAREQVLAAQKRELQARYIQHLFSDRVKAETINEELRYLEDRIARSREQAADLILRSGVDGTFVVPVAEDLPGRFVQKGQLIGHVLELGTITIRTIVAQENIDLVRQSARRVEVRLSEEIGESRPALIRRMVPGASERLPAKALGSLGGGEIATDPTDQHGVKAVQRVFQVDVELPSRARPVNLGGHAFVRFDHGWAPLGVQWYRSIRQLFLSRFNV